MINTPETQDISKLEAQFEAKIAAGKKADATTRSSMPKLTKMVVSQATINKIKTDGMTAALKKVGAGKGHHGGDHNY